MTKQPLPNGALDIGIEDIAARHIDNALAAYRTLAENDERYTGMVFLLESMTDEALRLKHGGKGR